jgi:hypothetical protein
MSDLFPELLASADVRYACVVRLDPIEGVDEQLIPVHMKLLPYFGVTTDPEVLVDAFNEASKDIEPLGILGLGEGYFGHRVRIVERTKQVQQAHEKFLAAFKAVTPIFNHPDFVGEGYVPHISPRVYGRKWIRRGERVDGSALQLFAAHPAASGVQQTLRVVRLSRKDESHAA